jgi:hypothetical protein
LVKTLRNDRASAEGVHTRQRYVLATAEAPEYLVCIHRLRGKVAVNPSVTVEILRVAGCLIQDILDTQPHINFLIEGFADVQVNRVTG